MARAQDVVRPDGNVERRKPVVGDMRWDGDVWERWSGRRWTRAVYSWDPARLADETPIHFDPPLDESRRRRALALAVEDQVTANGATLVLDGPHGAVLGYRPAVAHGLHAVMTVLTAGLWAVGWLAIVLGRRENRVRLEADDWGNVWARSVASA